jgi:hypothetical protein
MHDGVEVSASKVIVKLGLSILPKFGLPRLGPLLAMAAASSCVLAQPPAQAPDSGASTPLSWAEAAANNELRIIDDDGSFPLRYRMRKVDAKNDITRDIIESRQGTVARLVQRNGQPITAAEDAAERERLQAQLDSPGDFAKHHKRDNAARNYSMELVRQMSHAMVFTYTPGQPQRPNFAGAQVVLDFTPDPHYKPPSLVDDTLTGIEGRVWIDRKSLRVIRIEGHVLHPIDYGWGVLGRIYPGGHVEFEQTNAGGDRWAYAHVREDLTIRMIVKTMQERQSMDAADFQLLPAPVDYQEAIRILLATPLQLR